MARRSRTARIAGHSGRTVLSWLLAGLIAVGKPAGKWVLVNSGRGLAHVGVGLVGSTVSGGRALRDQAREYGEHGRALMLHCGCGCGQRMTVAQADAHLLAYEYASPADRAAIPAGEEKLAIAGLPAGSTLPGPRSRRWGWPREGEVMCPYCKDWVGPERRWSLHAEGCAAVAAVKQARQDRSLRWRHDHPSEAGELSAADWERIAVLAAERPRTWGLPNPEPAPFPTSQPTGGEGSTAQKETDMDVRGAQRGLDVVAHPGITPQNWETELPEVYRQVAALAQTFSERLGTGGKGDDSLSGYLARGDMPQHLVELVTQAASVIYDAAKILAAGQGKAEEYIAGQRVPFAKVS